MPHIAQIKKIDEQTNGNKCKHVACDVHTQVNKCCRVQCNWCTKWKHLLTFVCNTSTHAHIVICKTFGNICCKAGKKSWQGVKGSRPYSVRVTHFFVKMSVQMYPNVIKSEYTHVLSRNLHTQRYPFVICVLTINLPLYL